MCITKSSFKHLVGAATVAVVLSVNGTAFAQTPDINWFANNPDADTFYIANADQLAGLAGLVNNAMGLGQPVNFNGKTFILTDNIDLSRYGANYNNREGWIPIGHGASSHRFGGIFDGNGKTVRGLYIRTATHGRNENIGLFGRVDGGNIKNLGVIDVNISGGVGRVGAIAGHISNGSLINNFSTGTINSGALSRLGGYSIGGIVGRMEGDNSNITNCYFNGVIRSSSNSVGGVIGSYLGRRLLKISDCYSMGEIHGGEGVGGIVGGGNVDITNSYSTATINGTSSVGGVIGSNGNSDISGNVTNCYSTGSITGGNGVGGVVGSLNGNVVNSYSTGAISGRNVVGGVVGAGGSGTVTNSYSTGTIAGEEHIGGIAGTAHIVTNSYSIGAVSGNRNVGGIVGNLVNRTNWGGGDRRSGRAENNIALNPSVKSAGTAGRVVGFDRDQGILSNNAAFNGLTNNADNILWLNKADTTSNAVDITKETIMSDGTLGGRFTPENGWTIENGKLPGLNGQAVDIPRHLR